MAEVVLKSVCKSYQGEVMAVDHFDLVVRDGEFVALVGPSGCGKSTTLRMVAGLEEITAGTIAIDGRCVNEVPPKDRDIAMVFQNYALYPHKTVYENMAFGLKLRGMGRREIAARVREAAEILGLSELMKRLPKQLSGGQRQRVALGRAIVRQPKVFLFDEPLSNLDAKMRVEMRGEITRLHRRLQATMIYVTHDQVEAMTMGERIVVMDGGRIQQAAAPLEVYRNPANLFVASFIGTPPMNLLRGRLICLADSVRFCADETELEVALPPELGVVATTERAVWLGFRPETLHLIEATETHDASLLRGIVDVVEPMGAETFLQLEVGATTRCVARVGSERDYVAGRQVALRIESTKVALFDLANGQRLVAPTPPAREEATSA